MKLFLCLIVLVSATVYAEELDKICGTDQRVLSNNVKIGRTNKGCTITMISRTCALTAGHCVKKLEYAAFNVPESVKGTPQNSDPKDIYFIDQSSLKFQYKMQLSSAGQDWAVVRLNANHQTGKFAGDVQGYYPIKATIPKAGAEVRITGYGADEDKVKGQKGNYAQQTSVGKVLATKTSSGKSNWGGTSSSLSLVKYDVDTMPGNSGSVVILEKTGEVIGIHTYGFCEASSGGHNGGTLIAEKPDLKAAIDNCLASELN